MTDSVYTISFARVQCGASISVECVCIWMYAWMDEYFFLSLFLPLRITWICVRVCLCNARYYFSVYWLLPSVFVVVNVIKMRVHLLCQLTFFSPIVIARAQNMFIRFFLLCFPIPILFSISYCSFELPPV